MTLKDLQDHYTNGLSTLFPTNEINTFFRLLAAHKLGYSRADIVFHANEVLSNPDLEFFLHAFAELERQKPIQYIIGETLFYGLLFKVNNSVLIPRPETEELVDWILHEIKSEDTRNKDVLNNQNKATSALTSQLNILDIGTGSGCIAISLAKNAPKANIHALDISKDALDLASKNAKLNDVDITFIKHDILSNNPFNTGDEEPIKYDIIVSNPPYVLEDEKKQIKANVLDYEPHLALFVNDNNPLLFYEVIATKAKMHLKPNGRIFFEINQYLGSQTYDVLQQHGYSSIELRKDLSGNDRMLMGKLL